MDEVSDETPQGIIRTALRWAWDQDVISQQQAERGFDWLDEHTTEPVPNLPDEQAAD